MLEDSIQKLMFFRTQIHEIFSCYKDAGMDLVDALSTNNKARSVIQLSENKYFRRKCSSVGKVIEYFLVSDKKGKSKDDETDDSECIKMTDLHPDEQLQKEIKAQIVNLCDPPKNRNFFYLPATLLQQ